MLRATQISLRMKNEIGALAGLCRDLAHGGVNLLALSAPETGSVVRLLVANADAAARALTKQEYAFTSEQVIYFELKNRPGALARAMEKLHRAAIDVRYLYATASPRAKKTAAVLAVNEADLERAARLLAGH